MILRGILVSLLRKVLLRDQHTKLGNCSKKKNLFKSQMIMSGEQDHLTRLFHFPSIGSGLATHNDTVYGRMNYLPLMGDHV